MKFLAAILLIVSLLYPQADWWSQAEQSQRIAIRATYERNKKYNMGFTLAAFSIIESSGGVHLLNISKNAGNISENSGGVYAQKAYRVAQRVYSVETPTDWQVSRVLQNLITDRDFDDKQARAHIQELLTQYGGRWVMVWHRWNSQKPNQDEIIREWVRFFRNELHWK